MLHNIEWNDFHIHSHRTMLYIIEWNDFHIHSHWSRRSYLRRLTKLYKKHSRLTKLYKKHKKNAKTSLKCCFFFFSEIKKNDEIRKKTNFGPLFFSDFLYGEIPDFNCTFYMGKFLISIAHFIWEISDVFYKA